MKYLPDFNKVPTLFAKGFSTVKETPRRFAFLLGTDGLEALQQKSLSLDDNYVLVCCALDLIMLCSLAQQPNPHGSPVCRDTLCASLRHQMVKQCSIFYIA